MINKDKGRATEKKKNFLNNLFWLKKNIFEPDFFLPDCGISTSINSIRFEKEKNNHFASSFKAW